MLLFHKLNSTKKSKTRTKFCAEKQSNQGLYNQLAAADTSALEAAMVKNINEKIARTE